jgi:hypothetical protein
MFYREEFRIARVEELTIMYAMTKKENFLPIKLMAHYWLTVPRLKRGAVTCTSWVTRIANGLGLLDSAVIAYINTPHCIIDYSFFSQAHILRKRNRKIIMMYKGYAKEIDATLPELAFTNYFDFDRLGPSHTHHQPWEDQIPFDIVTSAGFQWGPSDHWGPGNYANYHPHEHGETSSGIQRGSMSFSA